jgi:hypothetical protein
MTLDPAVKAAAGEVDWEPNFLDYLFLAFNTSTAFSPTDVPVLSHWAKILMNQAATTSRARGISLEAITRWKPSAEEDQKRIEARRSWRGTQNRLMVG